MIDIILITSGIICLLLGIIGSILPALPGPPLSYIGLILLHLTDKVQFSTRQLLFWFVLVLITLVADYLLPVLGVKRWNGSKWGNICCIAGTIIGVFVFPPWGIIVGPFLGAFLGELLIAQKETSAALKAGFGAFLGFLMGTVLKLTVCGIFVYHFIKALIIS